MNGKLFWKQRIVEYLASKTKHVTYATRQEIEQQFGDRIDQNFHLSLNELIKEGIINEMDHKGKICHVLDVERHHDKIIYLLRIDNTNQKAELVRPSKQEFEGLILQFNNASERKYPNQGIYYYCTKKTDPNFWITLIKHTPNKKATKVILGSFDDAESRIYRIWAATKLAWSYSGGKPIVRKNVEDLEQKACGNNKIPSKCAFDIFVHLEKITIGGQKGLSKKYHIVQIKNYSRDNSN